MTTRAVRLDYGAVNKWQWCANVSSAPRVFEMPPRRADVEGSTKLRWASAKLSAFGTFCLGRAGPARGGGRAEESGLSRAAFSVRPQMARRSTPKPKLPITQLCCSTSYLFFPSELDADCTRLRLTFFLFTCHLGNVDTNRSSSSYYPTGDTAVEGVLYDLSSYLFGPTFALVCLAVHANVQCSRSRIVHCS